MTGNHLQSSPEPLIHVYTFTDVGGSPPSLRLLYTAAPWGYWFAAPVHVSPGVLGGGNHALESEADNFSRPCVPCVVFIVRVICEVCFHGSV